MNFVSETNKVNFAKNQQCIHNYFSVSNDTDLRIVETILAGTNSILKYLEDNEKLRSREDNEKK